MFSNIVLRLGYHHLKIQVEDIPKSAFRTHYGHYEFLVLCPLDWPMPQLNEVFKPFLNSFVIFLIDNIQLCSMSKEVYEAHLHTVLGFLKKKQLYAKYQSMNYGCL